MFEAKISHVIAAAVRTALRLLSSALSLWVKDPVKLRRIQAALNIPVNVVDILSDENPNDGDQILALINATIVDSELRDILLAVTQERINRLPADIRPIPEALVSEALTLADILTDDDKANAVQLQEYLRKLPRDPDGVKLLRALLGLWVDDQASADQLTLLILETLYGLLNPSDTRRDVIESELRTLRARDGFVVADPALLNPRKK